MVNKTFFAVSAVLAVTSVVLLAMTAFIPRWVDGIRYAKGQGENPTETCVTASVGAFTSSFTPSCAAMTDSAGKPLPEFESSTAEFWPLFPIQNPGKDTPLAAVGNPDPFVSCEDSLDTIKANVAQLAEVQLGPALQLLGAPTAAQGVVDGISLVGLGLIDSLNEQVANMTRDLDGLAFLIADAGVDSATYFSDPVANKIKLEEKLDAGTVVFTEGLLGACLLDTDWAKDYRQLYLSDQADDAKDGILTAGGGCRLLAEVQLIEQETKRYFTAIPDAPPRPSHLETYLAVLDIVAEDDPVFGLNMYTNQNVALLLTMHWKENLSADLETQYGFPAAYYDAIYPTGNFCACKPTAFNSPVCATSAPILKLAMAGGLEIDTCQKRMKIGAQFAVYKVDDKLEAVYEANVTETMIQYTVGLATAFVDDDVSGLLSNPAEFDFMYSPTLKLLLASQEVIVTDDQIDQAIAKVAGPCGSASDEAKALRKLITGSEDPVEDCDAFLTEVTTRQVFQGAFNSGVLVSYKEGLEKCKNNDIDIEAVNTAQTALTVAIAAIGVGAVLALLTVFSSSPKILAIASGVCILVAGAMATYGLLTVQGAPVYANVGVVDCEYTQTCFEAAWVIDLAKVAVFVPLATGVLYLVGAFACSGDSLTEDQFLAYQSSNDA